MINKGDIFYDAFLSVDERKGERSTVEFIEWHVTLVNKKGVYLRKKTDMSWGKRSKKQGDYGWLPVDSFIRAYLSTHHPTEEAVLKAYSKSKAAAYRKLLPEARKLKRDATRILTQIEKAVEKFKGGKI